MDAASCGLMRSVPPAVETVWKLSEIPPTGVGGLFRSNLQRVTLKFRNPTNRSWWKVQIRPPKPRDHSIQKGLQCQCALLTWTNKAGSEPSTNFRWWDSRTYLPLRCRPDLNHPPTPVGGISEFSHSLYRVVVLTSCQQGMSDWDTPLPRIGLL